MYIYYTPPVFCSYYVPVYIPYHYCGYYPFFADPYYSSPMTPITDWISANKYARGDGTFLSWGSSFFVPRSWGIGLYSRDMSFASVGDTLWYRSAGLTFFDSPWGTSWEFEPFVIARHEVPKQSSGNSWEQGIAAPPSGARNDS